jgi:hypothetical protein
MYPFPVVADIVVDGDNRKIHLEWTIESDPTVPEELIVCLSQVDRETSPGQSTFLDDNDIYISLSNLKQLCVRGLQLYKETTAIVHFRQTEANAELNELIASLDDDHYDE